MIKYLLFDIDNTLYPKSAGVFQLLGQKIIDFIVNELGISYEKAKLLRQRYLKQYGTSMLGLLTEYNINAQHYLNYVHDFSLEGIITKNENLNKVLSEIKLPKAIFTNSPKRHALNVLNSLGISHHFERIFDIAFFDNFIAKPHPQAYQQVVNELSVKPEECVLFDDSIPNLTTAKEIGMTPVLVSENNSKADFDYQIRYIEDLPKVLPKLQI